MFALRIYQVLSHQVNTEQWIQPCEQLKKHSFISDSHWFDFNGDSSHVLFMLTMMHDFNDFLSSWDILKWIQNRDLSYKKVSAFYTFWYLIFCVFLFFLSFFIFIFCVFWILFFGFFQFSRIGLIHFSELVFYETLYIQFSENTNYLYCRQFFPVIIIESLSIS